MPLARRVRPRLGTAGHVAGGPADDEGLSLQYASGGLVAGLDARRVFGRSQEALHPAPLSAAAVIARNASGEQQQGGIFVEEVLSPSSRRSGE